MKSQLPINVKIPLIVFISSLLTGLSFATMIHYSLNKSRRIHIEEIWKRQVPSLKIAIANLIDNKGKVSHKKRLLNLTQGNNTNISFFNGDGQLTFASNELLSATIGKDNRYNKEIINLSNSIKSKIAKLREKNKPYYLTYSKSHTTAFFPVLTQGKLTYVSMESSLSSYAYITKMILSIYLIAILLSVVVALAGIWASKDILVLVKKFINSLTSGSEHGFEAIETDESTEIGRLISQYNAYVKEITTLGRNAMMSNSSVTSSKPNDLLNEPVQKISKEFKEKSNRSLGSDAIVYLQDKLYDNPIRKFKNMELAFYPKLPNSLSQSFLSCTNNDHELNLLNCYFELNSLAANLLKHRVQEKFYTLSKLGDHENETLEIIWNYLNHKIEFQPGMLYTQLNNQTKNIKIVRGGPFAVFLANNDGVFELLDYGDDIFTETVPEFDSLSMDDHDALVIVSKEILETIELSTNKFQNKIISTLNSKDKLGKEILIEILERVFGIYTLKQNEKLPGIITVIKW